MRNYRNALAISLLIILGLYFVIFGAEHFWKIILSHFMFLALFPILVFLQVFSKNIPIKENISIQTVWKTIWKKECNFNKKTMVLLIVFLMGTDYLFDGIYGFVSGWLTWWSFAAGAWLVLLTIYSYQVYINPSNKDEESNTNPRTD